MRCIALLFVAPICMQAQAVPAARDLGPVLATTPSTFTAFSQLVTLSDGRVLISDVGARTVTLYDASLANPRTVLDSTTGLPNTFNSGIGASTSTGGAGSVSSGGGGGSVGGGGGGAPAGLIGSNPNFLIRFRGDSTLWYDNVAEVFVVLTPAGAIGRTLPPPALASLTRWRPPMPNSSPTLGLVYRLDRSLALLSQLPQALMRVEGQPDTVVVTQDSMTIVRMDFDTRKLDTLARLISGSATKATYGVKTRGTSTATVIYPFADDVVTTSDGSIVMLHAREYRLDWIMPDGARAPGPKLSFAWRHITDDLRQQIVDSVNGARKHAYDSLLAKRAADSVRLGAVPTMTSTSYVDGVAVVRQVPASPPRLAPMIVPAEVPDYYPPVPTRALQADGDGNVWIRQLVPTPDPAYAVWDVVSRTGGVIDRVRIPATRTIAGFAKGGIVFLVARDAGVSRIEKVRIR